MISGHDTSPVFAVGSLSHLMLIDDRDPNTTDITSVKVLEPAQGIRYVIYCSTIRFSCTDYCKHIEILLKCKLMEWNSWNANECNFAGHCPFKGT